MSTISDVARRAGVSAMTVSRVVNGSGAIAPATRERVEAAIAELGYVPNALGRQLRSKRTRMVGLVLSDITNPFFTTIARGVEDLAREAGYHVVFCDTDESDAEERRAITALVERQVDGILLVPASQEVPTLPLLAARRIPVVVLDRRIREPGIDSVATDSIAAARLLAGLSLPKPPAHFNEHTALRVFTSANIKDAIGKDGKAALSKGTWVIQGNNITVDNVEMYGAKVADRNGAALRLEGTNFTLRNSFIHDNEDGILSNANTASNILIEYTEFGHNGYGDGQSHNLRSEEHTS